VLIFFLLVSSKPDKSAVSDDRNLVPYVF